MKHTVAMYAVALSCAGLVSTADAFAQTAPQASADMTEAITSVLATHPDLLFKALESRPVEFAELMERATEAKAAQLKYVQRLEELENPKAAVVDAARPIRGALDAPITIVEYSDFECPYCRLASGTIEDLLQAYGDRVRFVYKHNPLEFHSMAEPLARHFEAIALQSFEAAWRFHDEVFRRQAEVSDGTVSLATLVAALPIDHQQLERDLTSEVVNERLRQDREEATRFGFDGTPAFLINGVSLVGSQPQEEFDDIIALVQTTSRQKGRVAAASVRP